MKKEMLEHCADCDCEVWEPLQDYTDICHCGHRHCSMEDRVYEALDNESQTCTREERERFLHQVMVFRNADVYADQWKLDADEFRAAVTELTRVTQADVDAYQLELIGICSRCTPIQRCADTGESSDLVAWVESHGVTVRPAGIGYLVGIRWCNATAGTTGVEWFPFSTLAQAREILGY